MTVHPHTAAIAEVATVLLAPSMACSSAPTAIAQPGRAIIRMTGSDTMVNLVQAWAEQYKPICPAVTVQVAGGGSGVGIAGLIDGTVDVTAASREMRLAERQRAQTRHGSEPREFIVVLDALAILTRLQSLPFVRQCAIRR